MARLVRPSTMAARDTNRCSRMTRRRGVGDGGTECKPVMRWPAPCLAWPVLRVCVARSVARYAINKWHVRDIVKGRVWAHVPQPEQPSGFEAHSR